MTGLDLSRRYYETHVMSMIHEKFPLYESRIAVGLVGEGSECFGFDDIYSQDHDYGPGLCMWLLEADYDKIGRQLQYEYEQLPAEFEGFPVHRDREITGKRTGVWEIGGFYRHFLGVPGVPDDWRRWLYLPEHYFAVAVNGEVFRDDAGVFSRIRTELLRGYPEDVRVKKIVARAAVMAQAGQYNYPRSVRRGDLVAAELALAEFIKSGMSMVYLLNRRYAPFYKWMHRGLKELDVLTALAALFEQLAGAVTAPQEKQEVIETICRLVVGEWNEQGLSRGTEPFLQAHLDTLMSRIENEQVRKLHWLEG